LAEIFNEATPSRGAKMFTSVGHEKLSGDAQKWSCIAGSSSARIKGNGSVVLRLASAILETSGAVFFAAFALAIPIIFRARSLVHAILPSYRSVVS